MAMEYQQLKDEYEVTKAFRKLFLSNDKLKPEAKIVLSYLRDVCGARGNLADGNTPSYLYDSTGRFDNGAAAFLLGRRRVFDMIVRHLSISDIEIFNLIAVSESKESDLNRVANILEG